jgi:hypothetical protein
MTHEIPFIFWPLLFIQILLFYKKSPAPAEAEKNLNSRSSPRAALSRARSRQEETNAENFVHHFLGETSDYTGDYRIIRTSSNLQIYYLSYNCFHFEFLNSSDSTFCHTFFIPKNVISDCKNSIVIMIAK